MTESSPQSRETLLQLAQELAQGDVTPERRTAAGEGLVWAASSGDLEMVELLLARGASPLAQRSTRESVLRAAHPRSPIVQAVRRAAEAAIQGIACHGLATLVFDRRYALRTDRGVNDLRRSVEERRQLDVLLVRSDVKTTARALADLVEAPRREADVAMRPVRDAQRLLFVVRLRGIDWTIVPFVFEAVSPWNVEHVKELAAAGTGIGPIARAIALGTKSRVLHVKYDEYTIYSEIGGIDTRRADSMDEELRELGVLVPPMRASTDGYDVQLQLFGLEPSDVERVDVVVLQEHGDPEVDRSVPLAAVIPALVGAPSMVGAPPMVRPEAIAEPEKTEPRPAMHEPPPMVAPAFVREPPPIVQAPPPVVGAVVPSEAPPLVQEPLPVVASKAPPPMVTSPVAANSAEPPEGDSER